MRCVHQVPLSRHCDHCEIMSGVDDYTLEQHLDDMADFDPEYVNDFEDDGEEQPGPDDYCYMGHAWCYDMHYAERRADEADWEADRDYFDPPTCPNCFATLTEDGTHWASGRLACYPKGRAYRIPLVEAPDDLRERLAEQTEAARLRADREREFHRSQPLYDPGEDSHGD